MSTYVSRKLINQFKNVNKLDHLKREIEKLDKNIDICQSALKDVRKCSVGGKYRVYEEDKLTGELILKCDTEQEAIDYYQKLLNQYINRIRKKKIKFDVLYGR